MTSRWRTPSHPDTTVEGLPLRAGPAFIYRHDVIRGELATASIIDGVPVQGFFNLVSADLGRGDKRRTEITLAADHTLNDTLFRTGTRLEFANGIGNPYLLPIRDSWPRQAEFSAPTEFSGVPCRLHAKFEATTARVISLQAYILDLHHSDQGVSCPAGKVWYTRSGLFPRPECLDDFRH